MTLPERALSVKQPWAWAILNAGKNIENRTWYSPVRGPIWIAASAQVTRAYYENARMWLRQVAGVTGVPELDELVKGAIIGRANVTSCILPGGFTSERYRDCISAATALALHGPNWGAMYHPPLAQHPLHPARFHFPKEFGFVLEGVEALAEPVPCKGLQRWWIPKPELLEQLRGRVAA
jgi:hypothetical protein